MGLCKNHDALYFDNLIRTNKAESVLSLIYATYFADGKSEKNIKEDIASRLKNAYEMFKGSAGTYTGDMGQFQSQYTIGLEMGIWKNSNLELSDMAIDVAKNKITIRDYFDRAFLNYIQPVNKTIVHLLYEILKYLISQNQTEISKEEMGKLFMEVSGAAKEGNINGAYNMLLGTNYFVSCNNGKSLSYCGKLTIPNLLACCNTQYIGQDLSLVQSELDTQEKYATYLLKDKTQNISDSMILNNEPHQLIYYGAPGTSKSLTINKKTKGHKTFRTTFHPDTDYSSFVGAYKPVMEEVEARVVPVVLNNGTSFDQNRGTLKEKKISYRFVKQAFMKAYIAAWKVFANNSNVSLSHQTPTPVSLEATNQIWIVTSVSNDKVLYTKEDIIEVEDYKEKLKEYWGRMPEPDVNTGRINLGPSFDHYSATGCVWYRMNHGKEHNADECWEAIKNVLEAGGTIEATPNIQTYSISLRDGKIVAVTRDNTAKKDTIKQHFGKDDTADTSVQKRIANELKTFDANDFDKAWEELKRRVNGVEIPESTNSNEVPPVFLIIEEINRGNCAQIFGDLFQLLDRENGFSQYPIHADEDIRKCLLSEHTNEDPSFGIKGLEFSIEQKALINSILDCEDDVAEKIARGEVLVLPPNLYIWATMNTSDQSLFPIDSAFKRRWNWKYMPIEYKPVDHNGNTISWTFKIGKSQYSWGAFLEKINPEIYTLTESSDKQMGYFFAKADPQTGIISEDVFLNKVLFYLWTDVFKDYDVSSAVFKNKEKNRSFRFTDFFEDPDALANFIENLELTPLDENDNIGDLEESNSAGFSLNGEALSLKDIANKVVSNYAIEHPELTGEAIRDTFVSLCKGIGVSHIVESNEDYQKRRNQPSAERSRTAVTLPNGETIHVTTQWRANKPDSNFIKFIEICKEHNLGIIERIVE